MDEVNAAVAFVDLAGFTALTEAHGDVLAADIAERLVSVTNSVTAVGDRLVKDIGDAVLLTSTDAASGNPAHPGQRHQPMGAQRRLHLGDLVLAPDEAADCRPEIARTRIERPQRRELRAHARSSDLKRPPGCGSIP